MLARRVACPHTHAHIHTCTHAHMHRISGFRRSYTCTHSVSCARVHMQNALTPTSREAEVQADPEETATSFRAINKLSPCMYEVCMHV